MLTANSTITVPRGGRAVSAAEFFLGALIVIGHNVWHALPNEVPILFVLALVSTRVRDGGWAALGLVRPPSWRRVVAIGVAAAALRIGFGELVVDPLAARIWSPAKLPHQAAAIAGDPAQALAALGLVWTFAAFGEEISYRGYLTLRGADIGGRTRGAWWATTMIVAVLFGYGHYYKGPAGIVDSAIADLFLGAAYLLSGRVLWTTIIAHGLIDSVGVAEVYLS